MDRDKIVSALVHTAAEFINRESNRQSLITVTRVDMDDRAREALIFISVYPDDKAYAALDFLNRNSDEFKKFVRTKLRMKDIARYRFLQDPHLAGVGEEVPVE